MSKLVLESVKELSFIINEKIGQLRDEQNIKIDQMEQWVNSILSQDDVESKIVKERCEICNSKETRNELELHHIAGRKHDFRVITVCKKCHRDLSIKQKLWDKRWLSENSSENLRKAFFLLGIYDILVIKTRYSGCIYEFLAKKYVEGISCLLKGD